MAVSTQVDLIPNRDLINPDFDHYQLSLDSVPVYDTPLDKNLDVAKPSETTYSSHHAKLFGLHNHLTPDPWETESVYFCDKEWNIGKVAVAKMGKPRVVESFFQVADSSDLRIKPARFDVSISFPSKDLAVVLNGVDHIYILETDDRHVSDKKWKVLYSDSVPVCGQAGVLIDSTLCVDGENRSLECLLASVEEIDGEAKEKHKSPWIMVLHWITFRSADGKQWFPERTRRLEGSRPFECACLDRSGSSIYIIAADIYKMVEDSVKPVEAAESWQMVGDEGINRAPMYTWSQTSGDISIHLTIPEGLSKASLNVDIRSDYLQIAVKNGVEMLQGDLPARVQVDASTWTLEGRRLEITLQKVDEAMWETVIVGDNRGEMVASPEQLEAIHERLAHLTSEDWNPNPEGTDKPYNSQMLEECDTVDGDGVILIRIDGESHNVTHKAFANEQFLFSVTTDPDTTPALCLRHDVDGLLWQASSSVQPHKSPWQHIGVLNAFGYVQASKEQRRFCTCSPNMDVAVIADSQRHVYLYRQKVSVMTPLRNRKTGQQVNNVAKQQVLSLNCTPDYILGIRVTNSKIFIATEQRVLVYVINPE